MAAPLKDSFGPEVAWGLGRLLVAVDPAFPVADFVAAATERFDDLELADRSRAVAAALACYLPTDPATAIDLITRSLPDEGAAARWQGMDSFMLWPFTMYVADHGLDCFEESMAAQHALTQLFTAEFSIRSFIRHRPEPTLARLAMWTKDDSEHVRRLVSEGTRPRLPWAPRLPEFVADPRPVLPLLEPLKDDPSEYVRRSVANNLNDIAKDHPEVTLDVCRQWLGQDASRRPMVRHALRTLVKAGDPDALAILGFTEGPARVADLGVTPTRVRIGADVSVAIAVTNPSGEPVDALIDFEVTFARPGGRSSRKVFKGVERRIAPGDTVSVKRQVTLRQLSTRRVHSGRHAVVALVNGSRSQPVHFDVRP